MLKDWSRKVMPNNRKIIKELDQKVKKVQEKGKTRQDYEKMREISRQINLACEREEMYWFQRSKVNWLKLKDKIQKTIHQSTCKGDKKIVLRIKREDGKWIDMEEGVIRKFELHFRNLFKSEAWGNQGDVLEMFPLQLLIG